MLHVGSKVRLRETRGGILDDCCVVSGVPSSLVGSIISEHTDSNYRWCASFTVIDFVSQPNYTGPGSENCKPYLHKGTHYLTMACNDDMLEEL
jgi:hypothetical protein